MNFERDNAYFQKVSLLVELLPFLAAHACFALKGGTAINLFVQDFPRLSVDVDLVYLPVEERSVALEKITVELAKLANTMEQRLPQVSVTRDFERGKLVVAKGNVDIKLEVNLNLRGSVLPAVRADIVSSAEKLFGSATVQMLNVKEVYAGKLVAALDRQHPRDLFDVKKLLDQGLLDNELLDLFLVYVLSSGRAITDILDPNLKDIESLFNNHFSGMTLSEISLAELVEARSNLLISIKKLLTEEHKQFLLSVKAGKADWRLFAYPEAAELPAVKFKLKNIETMSETKRKESLEKLTQVLFGDKS